MTEEVKPEIIRVRFTRSVDYLAASAMEEWVNYVLNEYYHNNLSPHCASQYDWDRDAEIFDLKDFTGQDYDVVLVVERGIDPDEPAKKFFTFMDVGDLVIWALNNLNVQRENVCS